MSEKLTEGSLYVYTQNRIATVAFGHPAANSFPSTLLGRLSHALLDLGKNPEVSVILIKSEGEKTFCAGASFDELKAVRNEAKGRDFFSGFAQLLNALRSCGKIVVGRAQGKAVGGGVGILSACDYVLASVQASVKLSELSIGIGPFVIAPALERKIGISGLSELALAPDQWKNAYWAKQKGLYAEVYDTTAELDKETDWFTTKLAGYSPEALSELKKNFWQGTENWHQLLHENAQISGRLVLSEFAQNALHQK